MLYTLGRLTWSGGGFTRPKPLLLLAYLILQGPQDRATLRHLFWPGDSDAAHRLRVTIHRLREALPVALQEEGGRLGTNVPCDAVHLLAAASRSEPEEVMRWYNGVFLQGVGGQDLGEELEEWLFVTRERLAGHARAALLTLGEWAAGSGDYVAAAARAERAFTLPCAPEPEADDLWRLGTLLIAGGSSLAGEARGEAKALRMVLPEDQDAARQACARPPTALDLPPVNLPFVGRRLELELLRSQLRNPTCRWVTLLAPGGTGKTRLVMEVARLEAGGDHWPGGVTYLAATMVETAEGLLEALCDAFNLPPGASLQSALKGWRGLLVVDNVEQIEGAATFFSELLVACSGVTLLVTTRERLSGTFEWVLELHGLNFTPGPERWSDAAQLFRTGTWAAQLDRILDESEAVQAQIEALAARLSGVPLALVLAASWSRTLPPGEILRTLQGNQGLLDAGSAPVEGRHLSMRAVFEQSWGRLNVRQQEILAMLSVFRGGIPQKAAEVVAGTTLTDLRALQDHALLQGLPDGRLDFHPLLREYAFEKLLASGAAAQVEEGHMRLYLRAGEVYEDGYAAAAHPPEDVENLAAAWRRAWDRRQMACLRQLPVLHSTFAGLSRMGLLTDLLEYAGRALDAVDAVGPPGPAMSMVGELELGVAVLFDLSGWSGRLGRHEVARAATERCLARLERLGERESRVYVLALVNLGESSENGGDLAAAERCYREAVTLSARHDVNIQAEALRPLAAVLTRYGCYEDAEKLLRRALTLPELDAYPDVMVRLGLADCLLCSDSGRGAEALELALSARLKITRRYEGILRPRVLALQARAALHTGQFDLGLDCCAEGLAWIGEDSRPHEHAELLQVRTQLLAEQGRVPKAFGAL